MAEFEAIGKALQIPQSVLNNIEKIDQKINLIASDSEKMATHFMSAMTRMGNGANDLLQKLNAIQSVVGKLDLSKFSQSVTTVGQGTTQVEQFAAAIAKAAEAINKYNAENRKSADVDNSKQIAQLNKEIEAMRKRTQQLEEYINKQRQANQGGGRRGGGTSSSTSADTKALNAYNRAMAASEALVTQRINKIAKLRQAEEMLRSASGNYATQLNRISQEIARLNRLNEGQVDSYGRVIRSQRNLVNTSQQLTRQLALLFSVSQIEGYISKLVQVRGEFELQQVALTSILQNKDQADQLFAQITDLAVRSPFTIKELTTYTKSLAAYQVQYEDLYDTTKMLADVSAGLGVDMQRLILAFGQVKAANFLRGTETRQFTEAGINMLGELSKYYTELEGRIVSVQEVQDRQFKRMISFQDVEEVFKRLTSAGGMFYNMQERQAETLAGQMSNLRDQFDLMFNEIGQDNQGSINVVISSIKLLIENWEIFANILKASVVGWTTYTATTLLAAAANGKFAASAVAATTSTKGLVGITAKLITSMKAFGTFLKTNPITIIATALASAIYFWNDHRKSVEENRKAYDPLVNSVNRTITAVDELTKKIGEQNERIKIANDNVGQYEKGTSEYARAEANANEEREKQNRLLDELQTKYPEIYNGIIRQKDGTVDYTNALRKFNGQLEQQNYLNYLARRTATGEDDGFLNNASKAAEAQQNLKIATEDANNALILMQGKIREYFATNEYASEDLRKRLEDVGNSSLSSGEKINKMFQIIRSEHGINIGPLKDMAWGFEEIGRGALKAEKELQDANERLAEDIKQISTEYKSAYDTTSEEGKRTSQELLENFLKNVGIQNQAVLDFVKQQFEVTIGVKIDLSNQVKQELGEVEKRVNDYLDENQFNLVGRIGIGESFEKYMKELQDSLKSWQTELNELESATGERVAGGTNKQRIDELKTSIAQATETLKYWGKYQAQATGGGSEKNPELEKLKEQVAMIEKAAKAYEDYRKLYDEETAQRMVETAFAKPFENLDLNFAMTFDAQGIIEAYRKLAQSVGGDAQEYIEGKIAEGLTDVTTDQRTAEVEAYRKQIDELFLSLENYQELEKLGLNKDLISKLFGINVSSIKDVQDVFENIKDKLKEYGNEGEKLIAESEKKITDAQQKELKNRLAQYAEFMRNSISERARIEIETQREIAKIQATQGMTQPMKDASIQNVRQQANAKISKLDWQDFQNSDVYTQLFQDLEYVSTSALKRIKENLDALKDSMSSLTPEQLKSINEYYSKLEEQLSTRNPFAAMRDSLKEIRELQSEGRTEEVINQELLNYEAQAELYKTQISDLETIIGMKQEGRSLDSLSDDLLQRNADILGKSTDELRTQLSLRKGQLSQVQTNIGISSKDLNSYDKARKNANNLGNAIQQIGSFGKEAFSSISSILDSMGVSMGDNEDAIGGLIDGFLNIAMQLGQMTILCQIFGVALNTALGPLGWAMMALQALTMIFSAFSKMHDNKIQEQIDAEQKKIDNLNKTYEKLEETIENGLSIWQYSRNSELVGNLYKQADSYRRMIDLERDKKKADANKIQEWKDEIEDLYYQIAQLYDDLQTELVGSFKDVSEQLADALQSAFEEGTSAAKSWGDTVNNIVMDIIKNFVATKLIEPLVQPILDDWFNLVMPKTNIADDANDKLLELINLQAKSLPEWQKMMKELGYSASDIYGIKGVVDYLIYKQDIKKQIAEAQEDAENAAEAAEGEIPNITGDLVDSLIGSLNDALGPVLGDELTSIWESLIGSSKDTMSGLQKGIQGLSEQTGQALEALLESCRYFISDSNTVLHNFYNAFQTPNEENPFLAELRNQTSLIQSINNTLSRLTRNATSNGLALKVQIV